MKKGKEVGNLGSSPILTLKRNATPAVSEESGDYQFILTFNSRAELIDVEYPEILSLAMTANHLAVAQLFLSQELVKRTKGEGGKA